MNRLGAIPTDEASKRESVEVVTSVQKEPRTVERLRRAPSESSSELRLDPKGGPIQMRDEDEDWAGVAAYAVRLGELMGELLGLEGFRGMDCQFKNSRWFISRRPNGEIHASKIRSHTEAERTRSQFGL